MRIIKKVRVADGVWKFISLDRIGSRYVWDKQPGHYFLKWWEGKNRRRELAGETPTQALDAQRRKANELIGEMITGATHLKPEKEGGTATPITMRRALEYARTENPPPPLKQIARCLGFTAEGVLVQAYPEVCHAYLSYRRSCLEQKRNRLRVAIRQWLATESAPSRTSLCRHFRIPLSTFEVNFPEENQEVVRRSSEQAQRARDNRHLTMRKEVLAIVRDLKSKNLYPSLPRVGSALSPGTVRYGPPLRAAVDEALSQLGPATRARNELGQYA